MSLRQGAKDVAQAVATDWPVVLGVFVFAIGLWAQPRALVGAYYDDGIYVVLAKALAEGRGLHYLHLPGAPAAVHYPPLYPAVLSLLWRLWPQFPANIPLFQLLDSAALGVSAGLIAGQVRRWQAHRAVEYVVLPAAFVAFPLLSIVGVRFSEPMFLAIAAGAFWTADTREPSIRTAVIAGVLAGLAGLTRSIGVAVVAGVAVGLWVRGGWKPALTAVVSASLLLAPWFGWVAANAHAVDYRIAPNYGSYATEASQAGPGAFLAGLDLRAFGPLARLVLPFSSAWLVAPAALVLLAAVVWAAISLWRRAPAFIGGLTCYITIVSVWPYASDRFMWIAVPWLAALAACGGVLAWSRGRQWRAVVLVVASVVGLGYFPREIRSLAARSFARTAEGASVPIRIFSAAVATGTPDSSVIATEAESAVYLYSGRLAVPNALFRWKGRGVDVLPADSSLAFLCDMKVTHVAVPSPASDGASVIRRATSLSWTHAAPVFQIANGPALYELRCRR